MCNVQVLCLVVLFRYLALLLGCIVCLVVRVLFVAWFGVLQSADSVSSGQVLRARAARRSCSFVRWWRLLGFQFSVRLVWDWRFVCCFLYVVEDTCPRSTTTREAREGSLKGEDCRR